MATDTAGHSLGNSAADLLAAASVLGGTTEIPGSLDIAGNALTLGTLNQGGISVNGFSILYTNNNVSGIGTVTFGMTQYYSDWLWNHAGNSGPLTAMELDLDHKLSLFDRATGNPTIVINPGLAEVGAAITINGKPVATVPPGTVGVVTADNNGNAQIAGNLELPATQTSGGATVGAIYQNGVPLIQDLRGK